MTLDHCNDDLLEGVFHQKLLHSTFQEFLVQKSDTDLFENNLK